MGDRKEMRQAHTNRNPLPTKQLRIASICRDWLSTIDFPQLSGWGIPGTLQIRVKCQTAFCEIHATGVYKKGTHGDREQGICMQTSNDETHTPSPKVRRFRWWFVPLGLFGILLVSYLLVWWIQGSALNKRYAKIRAAGQPVTPEELNEYYALPEGVEDTTELWQSALLLCDETVNDPEAVNLPVIGQGPDIPPSGQPWPEKDAVASFLAAHADTMEAIHRAADASGDARFPRDFSQGINMLLPDVQSLRSAARLLRLEAHVHNSEGNTAGTVNSIRAMFALGETLHNDPVLVSFLVRVAIDSMAIDAAAQLLSDADPTREQLVELQQDLRTLDYSAELENALIGERVFGLNILDNPGQAGFGTFQAGLIRLAATGSKVKYLDLMSDGIEATNEPWNEAIADQPWLSNWNPNNKNPFDVMVAMIMPTLDHIFEAGARQTSEARSLEAAIAAELYRRDHGQPPASLEELVPDYLPTIPIDPFTGDALQYKTVDDGFLVYGLGKNLADDGGDLANATREPLDIGIRWGAAPEETQEAADNTEESE